MISSEGLLQPLWQSCKPGASHHPTGLLGAPPEAEGSAPAPVPAFNVLGLMAEALRTEGLQGRGFKPTGQSEALAGTELSAEASRDQKALRGPSSNRDKGDPGVLTHLGEARRQGGETSCGPRSRRDGRPVKKQVCL